jgi:hypothetical protein
MSYTKEEIVKALNGLEITWFNGEVGIPAIVLCPEGDKISIKATISAIDQYIIFAMAGWDVEKMNMLKQLQRYDACLTSFRNANESRNENLLEYCMGLAETKRYDADKVGQINQDGDYPTCSFV